MVSMLLAQALFLGIFIGAFDISAHSLFLAIFDEKMLAKGYMVSGFAGIILLSLYFFLQARMKFRNFEFLNLIAVAAITLFLWISLVNKSFGHGYLYCIHYAGPSEYPFGYGIQDYCGNSFHSCRRKKIICHRGYFSHNRHHNQLLFHTTAYLLKFSPSQCTFYKCNINFYLCCYPGYDRAQVPDRGICTGTSA